MGGFDVVALQGICANYFEKHVSPLLSELREAQDKLRVQVSELTAMVDQKGAHDVTAKLDALVADMSQKASLEKLDEILAKIDSDSSKTSASDSSTEAPSADQLDLMLSEAEQKCRDHMEKSLAALEERLAISEKTVRSHAAKIAEFKKLDSELECKANVRDVPTLAQFQRLSASVDRKANASKVPTMAQFQDLEMLVESKVSASCVPTVAEFRELRQAVEKKADARSVPCDVDLQKVLAEVKLKASVEDLQVIQEDLNQKANSKEVPLISTVDNLASVMERKLAFLAARLQKTSENVENVLQNAMVCYVPAQPCPASGTWYAPVNGGQDGYAPGGWGQADSKQDGSQSESTASS